MSSFDYLAAIARGRQSPVADLVQQFPKPPQSNELEMLMANLNDPNMDFNLLSQERSGDMELGEVPARVQSQVLALPITPAATEDLEEIDLNDGDSSSQKRGSPSLSDQAASLTVVEKFPFGPKQEDNKGEEEDEEFDDESPYPEVRMSVSSTDDPNMPVNTIRMWIIGIFFAILVSGVNQMMSLRYPSIFLSDLVILIISLPLGKAFACLPKYRILGCDINPGPFTVKEHVVITMMANVASQGAYATDIFATQQIFYGQTIGYLYQILLALGTQLFGFALGAILRQIVVWPRSMIWPSALVYCALFNTMHKGYGKRERGHMPRERYFLIVCVGAFVWYFIPGYLFTALSVFNWVCWIVPENVTVNSLFGTYSGLGMSALTFDWSMIAYNGSPLATPWWVQANTMVAMVLCFWVVVPIWYFTNTWNTAFMPISSPDAFDNMGYPYNPSIVVNGTVFDEEMYRQYSPVFLSASLCMAYGVSFASFTALIVHVCIWFGKQVQRQLLLTENTEKDVHSRLMQKYPEVPLGWYMSLGLSSILMVVIAVGLEDTALPVWAAMVAFCIAAALAIPVAIIMAISNIQVALQVLHEMIAGYMIPGKPIANAIFKTIAYNGTTQAIGFSADLKLGHYMKVPPRISFAAQCISATIACFVATGVQAWMFSNVEGICTDEQVQGFVCPSTMTFAAATLIWGGVGPARLFNIGQPYAPLLWFFLIGAVLPIPCYILAIKYPRSFWRYVNIPVFFAGITTMPPASGINFVSWAIVGFIFNYYIRTYHFRWWMRFNYIISAGLDCGTVFGGLAVFLFLYLPKGGIHLDWWGNTVWTLTADVAGLPLKMVTEGEIFGPLSWA